MDSNLYAHVLKWTPIDYKEIPSAHRLILNQYPIPGVELGEAHSDPKYFYFRADERKKAKPDHGLTSPLQG